MASLAGANNVLLCFSPGNVNFCNVWIIWKKIKTQYIKKIPYFFKIASLKACMRYWIGQYRWLDGDPVWDVLAFLLTKLWSTYPLHDYDEFIPWLFGFVMGSEVNHSAGMRENKT
jgi:hypothetical protein